MDEGRKDNGAGTIGESDALKSAEQLKPNAATDSAESTSTVPGQGEDENHNPKEKIDPALEGTDALTGTHPEPKESEEEGDEEEDEDDDLDDDDDEEEEDDDDEDEDEEVEHDGSETDPSKLPSPLNVIPGAGKAAPSNVFHENIIK